MLLKNNSLGDQHIQGYIRGILTYWGIGWKPPMVPTKQDQEDMPHLAVFNFPVGILPPKDS